MAHIRFDPRQDDTYVVTYPRSGTTWMQMILYQMFTDGSMSFRHISEMIPFLEVAMRTDTDLTVLSSPRIFKTHLPYQYLARNPGKFIYVVRDGRDVLVSYFRFLRAYHNDQRSFAVFFDDFLEGRVPYGSWFRHTWNWRSHAEDSRVLWLRYEELIQDPGGCIDRISLFCGCPLDHEQRSRILDRSTFVSMKRFEHKFVPQLQNGPSEVTGAFMPSGAVGSWREVLTEEQKAAFDRKLTSFQGPDALCHS